MSQITYGRTRHVTCRGQPVFRIAVRYPTDDGRESFDLYAVGRARAVELVLAVMRAHDEGEDLLGLARLGDSVPIRRR